MTTSIDEPSEPPDIKLSSFNILTRDSCDSSLATHSCHCSVPAIILVKSLAVVVDQLSAHSSTRNNRACRSDLERPLSAVVCDVTRTDWPPTNERCATPPL